MGDPVEATVGTEKEEKDRVTATTAAAAAANPQDDFGSIGGSGEVEAEALSAFVEPRPLKRRLEFPVSDAASDGNANGDATAGLISGPNVKKRRIGFRMRRSLPLGNIQRPRGEEGGARRPEGGSYKEPGRVTANNVARNSLRVERGRKRETGRSRKGKGKNIVVYGEHVGAGEVRSSSSQGVPPHVGGGWRWGGSEATVRDVGSRDEARCRPDLRWVQIRKSYFACSSIYSCRV